MVYLATFFYFASFIFQVLASWFALISFRRTGQYRFGWLFFSIALLLMLGRRVSPMLAALRDLHANVTDAALSLPISFLLLVGVLSIRKAFGELEEKTEKLSCSQKLDFLTSALTRTELFVLGEKEIERSLRSRRAFALLMLDLDHFKNVNDRFGHQKGDEVLKSLTCICHNTLRKIDIFGRYGGEEFVAILPETSIEHAREVAERLRKNVSDHLAFAARLEEQPITISVGVAVFEPNGDALEDRSHLFKGLVEHADMAMYHAKNSGRNQVSVFEYANSV